MSSPGFVRTVIVTDASSLVMALADDGSAGRAAHRRLRDADLHAPEIVDLEVLSVLRREVGRGSLSTGRAAAAIADLQALSMRRTSHLVLLARCWELRDNLTPYDASYVALAEALGCPLVTMDARLADATGIRCVVEVLS